MRQNTFIVKSNLKCIEYYVQCVAQESHSADLVDADHSSRIRREVLITLLDPFVLFLSLSLSRPLPLVFVRSDGYNYVGLRYLAAKDPLEQNLQNELVQTEPTYSASTPSHLAAIPTFFTSRLLQPP